MKYPIRFFSIGLFTSALLLLLYNTLFDTPDEPLANVSTEELVAMVEDSGYRVITDEEFISYSLYVEEKHEREKEENKSNDKKDKDDNKKKKDNEVKKEKEEKEKKEKDEQKEDMKKISFTISKGDVSEDIAHILNKNDIIDDPEKFIDYLEDNDYSKYIQLGTFEVTSEMSLKEIAKVITTYPGE